MEEGEVGGLVGNGGGREVGTPAPTGGLPPFPLSVFSVLFVPGGGGGPVLPLAVCCCCCACGLAGCPNLFGMRGGSLAGGRNEPDMSAVRGARERCAVTGASERLLFFFFVGECR